MRCTPCERLCSEDELFLRLASQSHQSVLIGVYYHNKNGKCDICHLALQLWLYLVTGHKQVLFLIFVVFVIMRFFKWLKDLLA